MVEVVEGPRRAGGADPGCDKSQRYKGRLCFTGDSLEARWEGEMLEEGWAGATLRCNSQGSRSCEAMISPK